MTQQVTSRKRGQTRVRIQDVALERFTANGYDQTSLREIAEDLGVTKAALYHHFKSKEEILDSLVAQVASALDDLVAWMESEPPTRERRIEMLRRLGEITRGTPGDVMRCVQQNEAAFQHLATTTSLVHDLKQKLWRAALPAPATVEDGLRMRLAVMAVLVATKPDSDLGGSADERADAAQRVAASLVP